MLLCGWKYEESVSDLETEAKVVLRGSHATTLSRYRSIAAEGFRRGRGRGGSGVYFWAEAKRYLDLSKAWYDWCLATRRYATDEKKECIIIIALLTAPLKQILNLEEQKLKDAIDTLAEKRRLEIQQHRGSYEAVRPLYFIS